MPYVVETGTMHDRIQKVHLTPAPTITAALVPFKDHLARIRKGFDTETLVETEAAIARISAMIPGAYTKASPFEDSIYLPYSGMTILVKVWGDDRATRASKADKPRKGLVVQKPRKPRKAK